MFYLVWISGESREERHADPFLSEFHTWPLLWHTLRSRKAGNLRLRGEGSRTSGAAMGPWESGRFWVRNEADFWTVPLRSQWVGQIRQTAANPPTTSLSPRSSIRPQTASVSSTMCLSPLCLSLLNIYNKWVTDMVLTETRLTTLTRLTSLFSLRCAR